QDEADADARIAGLRQFTPDGTRIGIARSHQAQPAGMRDRRSELATRGGPHRGQQDRMLDPQQASQSGLDDRHGSPPGLQLRRAAPRPPAPDPEPFHPVAQSIASRLKRLQPPYPNLAYLAAAGEQTGSGLTRNNAAMSDAASRRRRSGRSAARCGSAPACSNKR